MIKEYFARCEVRFPEQRAQLRQVSLALRREQIDTIEQLYRLFQNTPEALADIRSIGEKRLGIIERVCKAYEADCCPAAARQERREGVL